MWGWARRNEFSLMASLVKEMMAFLKKNKKDMVSAPVSDIGG